MYYEPHLRNTDDRMRRPPLNIISKTKPAHPGLIISYMGEQTQAPQATGHVKRYDPVSPCVEPSKVISNLSLTYL